MKNSTRLDIFIEERQKTILEAIKKRDGIPISEQVRRAIDKYIQEKEIGVLVRPNRESVLTIMRHSLPRKDKEKITNG
jgi:hypothetical protein